MDSRSIALQVMYETHPKLMTEGDISMQHTQLKPSILELLHYAHTQWLALPTELSDAERSAIGTQEHWSVRDYIAHITFWKQHSVHVLAAAARDETPTLYNDEEIKQLNAQVFEQWYRRSLSDVLNEAERVYIELVAQVQGFTEEDLVSQRFTWIRDGEPLWVVVMGNGYWHPQEHFTNFYRARNDLSRATRVQNDWVDAVVQRDVPEAMRGIVLYNQACFYATSGQTEKALEPLRQALSLYPELNKWSQQDRDLDSLREQGIDWSN